MSAVSARLFAIVLGLVPFAAANAQDASSPTRLTDEATDVSDVVVKAPPTEVPVPDVGRGAPVLSSAQTRALVFDARASSGGSPGSGRRFYRTLDEWLTIARVTNAHNATEEAERFRREAARGLRTQAEVEFAELRRQGALSGAGISYARAPALETLSYPPTAAVLENAKVRFADDGVGQLLIVSGMMRNTTAGKADAPSLLVTVVDPLGFITGERAMDPRFDLAPGQSRAFVFFFRVPPINLREVRLALVDPKSPRPGELTPLPASAGDIALVARPAWEKSPEIPIPLVGEGAPAYTADDLRRLRLTLDPRQTADSRLRSEVDLILANGGTLGDAAALLAAQQATETARVSRRQAIVGRRTQKEVEDAELARQAAVLAAIGPVRPVIHELNPGVADVPSVKNLRANLMTTSTTGLLRISGTMRDSDGQPAPRSLTIQMLDAQGFVLAQRTVDPRTAGPAIGRAPTRQAAGSFDFTLADPPKHIEAVRVVAP